VRPIEAGEHVLEIKMPGLLKNHLLFAPLKLFTA